MDASDKDIVGIVVFNDDATPMELVVHVLREQFGLRQPEAVELMLEVHNRGFAVVETLPRAEARRKLLEAQKLIDSYSRQLVLRLVEDPAPIMQASAAKAPPERPRNSLLWLIGGLLLGVVGTFFLFWLFDWIGIFLDFSARS